MNFGKTVQNPYNIKVSTKVKGKMNTEIFFF